MAEEVAEPTVRGIQRPKDGFHRDHMVDAIAGVMLVLLTGRAFQNLRELAKDEPAAPRR